MSTMPAWQKREMEIQDFRGKWEQILVDAHDGANKVLNIDNDTFAYELAGIMVRYMSDQDPRGRPKPEIASSSPVYIFAKDFWLKLMQELRRFQRSDVEGNDILARFFEKNVVPKLTYNFHREALAERLESPRQILRAERGDAEVPISTEPRA